MKAQQVEKIQQLLNTGEHLNIELAFVIAKGFELNIIDIIKKSLLHNNQLAVLPNDIGNLSQLQMLDLSSNYLMSLPESIQQLQALQTLNLRFNQFTSIPPEIRQLHLLQKLILKDNPLSQFEREKIRQLLPHMRVIF